MRDVALDAITTASVRHWYGGLAVGDELIRSNPCKIKGGEKYRRGKQPAMASLAGIAPLRAAMPAHSRCAIDLEVWASLRIGEVIGLQRGRSR